jgi:hypothetical protein
VGDVVTFGGSFEDKLFLEGILRGHWIFQDF